jgi:hypothetical protein
MPVGSPPVSFRSIMRKDLPLLMPVGVRCMAGAGIKSAWRRLHGGLALIRCFEVLRSVHGLEIHWNAAKAHPRWGYAERHAITKF